VEGGGSDRVPTQGSDVDVDETELDNALGLQSLGAAEVGVTLPLISRNDGVAGDAQPNHSARPGLSGLRDRAAAK
jgi:hypothetical protein